MNSASLAVAAFVVTASFSAVAQSIDELPPDVYQAALRLERTCAQAGGSPDYEPLELVTFVFFGNDWDNGGRESYVIDTSRIRCAGAAQQRPWCKGPACQLIVMVPTGRTGFNAGLDRRVVGWRLVGDNASSNGPNVLLEVEANGRYELYKADNGAMTRTGPGGG